MNAVMLRDLCAEVPGSVDEAQMVELRRMKLVGQPMDIRRDALGETAEVLGPALYIFAHLALFSRELLEFNCQQRQPLIHIIVELSCNSPPLLLLSVDEPAAEISYSLLGEFCGRDVQVRNNCAAGRA